MKVFRALILGLCLVWPGLAAAIEEVDLERAGLSPEMAAWAMKSVRGDWNSVGAYGQLGAFGVPFAGIGDYRIGPERFLDDRNAQVRLWLGRERRVWDIVVRTGLDEVVVGKEVCLGDLCAIMTASSLLAICRAGCAGPESPVRQWMRRVKCNDGPEAERICRTAIANAGQTVEEITRSARR